jgi:hypothetical protein
MRRRLTNEEREIRQSRSSYSFRRWWPFAALVIANFVAVADSRMFELCLGRSFAEKAGRGAGMVRGVLVYPCSPFLMRGAPLEWMLFASLWLPIPFAILTWRWAKRRYAYWEPARQRERARRAQKRVLKTRREAGFANESQTEDTKPSQGVEDQA